MRIIRENPNARFDEAWQYVDRTYAHLIRESFLDAVILLDEEHHMPGADGLHIWYKSDHADITVRNNPDFDVAKFIEILVHELTHLVQCSSGRFEHMTEEEMEKEAYPAGQAAKSLYELAEFERLAAAMKTAADRARFMRRAA